MKKFLFIGILFVWSFSYSATGDTLSVDTLKNHNVTVIDEHLIITDSVFISVVTEKTKEIKKDLENKDYSKVIVSVMILLFAIIAVLKRKKNG
jgi:surface polysaccharide O-acyltransferase-like enzyme